MAQWTDADQEFAQIIGEHLPLAPGEQVEHFVFGASVGSGVADGELRRVFVVTCCRDCTQPAHLMNHVIDLLGDRNLGRYGQWCARLHAAMGTLADSATT